VQSIFALHGRGLTDEQVAARPELAEERERPMMLLVSAHG
jgi:hypothetical protein